MRVVVQRVSEAAVDVDDKEKSRIGRGLVVLLGIEQADDGEDAQWLVGKLLKLRIFPDDGQLMNCSVSDIGGEILVVSQFTLHASTRKGNRPSFIRAAQPDHAIALYERFISLLEQESGKAVASGSFGADMRVSLVNDGPVTICMDSKARE